MKKTVCYVLLICLLLTSSSFALSGCKNIGIFSPKSTEDVSGEDTGSNSRKNPANVNEKVIYDSMQDDYDAFRLEITLLEVLRGGGALKMLIQADNYNEIPPDGKEYLLAKFRVNVIQSKNDEPVEVKYYFDVVKSDGLAYSNSPTYPYGIGTLTTMYQGSTQEGYVCFLVDTNDKEPLIVFPVYGESRIWFSGKQTAGSEYDDYSPLGDPNKVGSENNPAKLNETANFNGIDLPQSYYTFSIDITVTELNRGQRALDLVMNADEYYSEPPVGKELLIAKVEIEAIHSKDDAAIDIHDYDFELFSDKGRKITEREYVYGIGDTWLSEMYPGDVQEIYLVFIIDESESNPSIVAFSDTQAPVWFSASQSNREPKTKRDETIEAWALGCSAILATNNGYDPYQFGMFRKNPSNATIASLVLSGSWGVYNRDDLIDVIARMQASGHNAEFRETYIEISKLTASEYKDLLKQAGDAAYMVDLTAALGEKWGDKYITAWDWFRVIHLAGWGYIAGYIELQEAYDYMKPVITLLRNTFSSWDEAVDNYMDGYAWWSNTDVSKQGTEYKYRLGIYEDLKSDKALFDPAVWK